MRSPGAPPQPHSLCERRQCDSQETILAGRTPISHGLPCYPDPILLRPMVPDSQAAWNVRIRGLTCLNPWNGQFWRDLGTEISAPRPSHAVLVLEHLKVLDDPCPRGRRRPCSANNQDTKSLMTSWTTSTRCTLHLVDVKPQGARKNNQHILMKKMNTWTKTNLLRRI